MRTSWLVPAALAAVIGVGSPPPTATAAASGADPTVHTGSLPGGATWEARVPADWNGTVVLFAHGFRVGADNPAWDAGFAPTAEALGERDIAVVSSSYAATGWALGTAVRDQLDSLEAFEQVAGEADRVIAMGRSMGGLVTSLTAETPGADIDAAVSTCGLVGGGVALNNYQLDAAHAALQLLAPETDVPLVGFTSVEESQPTADALTRALDEALTRPEGRARVALVAALLNTPTELPGVEQGDPEALAAAQAELVRSTLPEVIRRRSELVNAAGGDSGWNAGVDYAALLRLSAQRDVVLELYRKAGLDLAADLAELNATANIEPDADALAWMEATSVPTGDLRVPLLATHTLVDVLAPVEYQEEYAETVREAGKAPLLRQAYVDRVGHCRFTVAENIAAVEAVNRRLETGTWGGAASAGALDAAADKAQLDGGGYVRFRPDEFVNDRDWAGRE